MTSKRNQPNYLAVTLTICFTSFIVLIQFPLIFISPVLEYMKIQLFKEYKLPIDEIIEYLYFILLLSQISITLTLCYCCCINEIKQLNWELSVVTLLWIIIPIIYTYNTIYELGDDIPIFCPSNYKYSFPRFICQIHIANLICMWLMFISTLLATFIMFIPEYKYKEWFGVDENGDVGTCKI